jgi:hypothetical protein
MSRQQLLDRVRELRDAGRQHCGGDPVVDVVFDGAQGGAELRWGLGPAGGEQRAQDAVADFGVEDRELQAVGGQVVGAGVRPAGDQPVARQPG